MYLKKCMPKICLRKIQFCCPLTNFDFLNKFGEYSNNLPIKFDTVLKYKVTKIKRLFLEEKLLTTFNPNMCKMMKKKYFNN